MKKCLVVAVFSAGASALALADGFYAGINGGEATMADLPEIADSIRTPTTAVRYSKSEASARIFAGFNLSPTVALEVGWADLGRHSLETSTFPSGNSLERIKIEASFVDVVGKAGITEKFSLLGRVGYARTKTKWNQYIPTIDSNSKTELGFKFGMGAQYFFGKSFAVRLEQETYLDVGHIDTTYESNIHVTSLGLLYQF